MGCSFYKGNIRLLSISCGAPCIFFGFYCSSALPNNSPVCGIFWCWYLKYRPQMRVPLQNYYGNSGYFFHSDDCHRWHNLWQHPAVHCSSRYKNKCPFPDPPQNKLPSGHRKRPGYCPQKPVSRGIRHGYWFCLYIVRFFPHKEACLHCSCSGCR